MLPIPAYCSLRRLGSISAIATAAPRVERSARWMPSSTSANGAAVVLHRTPRTALRGRCLGVGARARGRRRRGSSRASPSVGDRAGVAGDALACHRGAHGADRDARRHSGSSVAPDPRDDRRAVLAARCTCRTRPTAARPRRAPCRRCRRWRSRRGAPAAGRDPRAAVDRHHLDRHRAVALHRSQQQLAAARHVLDRLPAELGDHDAPRAPPRLVEPQRVAPARTRPASPRLADCSR